MHINVNRFDLNSIQMIVGIYIQLKLTLFLCQIDCLQLLLLTII